MLSIRQNGQVWELLDADGTVLSSHATYDVAVAELSILLGQLATLAVEPSSSADTGLLPERWVSDMAFSEETGEGRDFTGCTWTSRDPNVSTIPLMLQTTTDVGHFGAELAGFVEQFDNLGARTNPTGSGRFYDSDAGRKFRDMLLDGRRFGVSVDAGGDTDGDYTCDVMDDDGFCEEGHYTFTQWEIIGLTGTPFPAFAAATIRLDAGEAAAPEVEAEPVAASARTIEETFEQRRADGQTVAVLTRRSTLAPTRPPLSWFRDPSMLMPTPLTITDQGHVLGHVAAWGTCHVGDQRMCITPPSSQLAYERFAVGGVVCDDGTYVDTGALTWGIPHAELTASLLAAQAHYADSRHGWADVAVGEDEHGIWISGALRPGVSEDDVRVLRALALSGDWRHDRRTGGLEMVAALAVNVPGFPIPRAVVASGRSISQPTTRAGVGAGQQQTALVASGIVLPAAYRTLTRQPCGCEDGDAGRLARIERVLSVLDRRTRHLNDAAAERLAERVAARAEPTPAPASYTPRAR